MLIWKLTGAFCGALSSVTTTVMRFSPVAMDLCERRADTFQRDDVAADAFRGRGSHGTLTSP